MNKEKKVLLPPDIVEVEGPVIFLAGPIQGAPDWQEVAIETIHSLDDGITVASPRKKYSHNEFVYEAQVDWETHYLARAAKMGAVMFWLAVQEKEVPDLKTVWYRSYAQTSRFELGEHFVKKQTNPDMNLVVGIERGFGNERYIRRRLGQTVPEVPILDSLKETCQTTVNLVRRSSGKK